MGTAPLLGCSQHLEKSPFPAFLEQGACCGCSGWAGSGRGPRQAASSGLGPPPPLHRLPCGTDSPSVIASGSWSPSRLAEMPALGQVMENGQVLPAFLLCSTLLIIKMYAVGVITGYTRLRKKVRELGWGGGGSD